MIIITEFVNKNLKIRIYPSKADFNDKDEKIVSISKIEQISVIQGLYGIKH
ncbi:hypothetical protein [Methanobrevibacter sp. V74]|uniref:hypothetical protein n=1 Tax=Methanobrevibacter sp. V74 TaxID=3064279 RepID=UPI002733444A|nr:hypothetical protein [Methanobrevibacter sp. V74]